MNEVETFNENHILRTKILLEELMLRAEELANRAEINDEFLMKICGFSATSTVWALLWNVGPQRFTELSKICDMSSRTVSLSLNDLLNKGLVDKVGDKYRALTPVTLQK